MSESSGQCEPGLQGIDIPVPNRGSSRRHPLLCAECHKQFRTQEELYTHSELCIIESFENEAVSVFSSMPSLTESSIVAVTAHSGITARGDGPPRLVPETTITIRPATLANVVIPKTIKAETVKAEHSGNEKIKSALRTTSSQPCTSQPKQQYRSERLRKKPFELENARILKGPSGLELFVSIEGESGRGNGGASCELDVHDYAFGVHASGAPDPKRKVIGALANADDDDTYRPKIECPTCGLILYRHNFGTHYRIHTGELPFACTYCEKRFRTTSSLKVHIRAHTGEKPYSCPRCPYCCITKRNLDRHFINNHVREGERRGPRQRRSRYRRDEYSVIIDEPEMGIVEDPESEQIDHHYVISPEEVENTETVPDKVNESMHGQESDDNGQPPEMPILPLLNV